MTKSLLLFNVSKDALKFSLFEINGTDTPLLYGSIRSTPIGFVFRVRIANTRLSDLVVLSPFADVGLAAIYVASWVRLNYKHATTTACVHQQTGRVAEASLVELSPRTSVNLIDPDTKTQSSLDLVTAALWQQYPGIRQFVSTAPCTDRIIGPDRPDRRESEIAQRISAQFFEAARAYA